MPGRCYAAILLALALLAGCASRDASATGGRTRLRVAIQPYLPYAPLYVAQADGIFAAHGLDVEFVPLAGSEPGVPLLIQGSVDVLQAHITPGLLNAVARGERIRMVAERSRWQPATCSFLALVARPGLLDTTRRVGTAPRIRRISMDKQATVVFFVEEALATAGVSLDTLEQVHIPHALEPDALAAGTVDVALAGEPHLSRTLAAGKGVEWIGLEDVLPLMEFSVLFYGRRLLDEDRAAGRRFAAAWLEANRRLGAGKTPHNVELVSRFLELEPAELDPMCWP
jgi:NitT/TauT family transport system substrate-binding protein